MIQKALQILQENQDGLIFQDNGKKYIQFDIINFEIDEDYPNFITYDVRYDMGRNAYVDLNLYENNLKSTILQILKDNGINAKIKRMGFIRIKEEEDTMEKMGTQYEITISDNEKVTNTYKNGVRIQTPNVFDKGDMLESIKTYKWREEIGVDENDNIQYKIGEKYVIMGGKITSEEITRSGKYLKHYINRLEAEDFDCIDRFGRGFFFLVDEDEVDYKTKPQVEIVSNEDNDDEDVIIEFQAVKENDCISGYMYLSDADDEAPLHFYDKQGFEKGTHLPYSDSALYEAFTTDEMLIQTLVDFATENKTIEMEGYTLHINEGAKMEVEITSIWDLDEYEFEGNHPLHQYWAKVIFKYNNENIYEIMDNDLFVNMVEDLDEHYDMFVDTKAYIKNKAIFMEMPKAIYSWDPGYVDEEMANDIIEEYRNVAQDYLARQFTSDLGVYARYGEMMEQDIETNFADDNGLQTLYHFVETGDSKGFHNFLIDKGYEVEDEDVDTEGIEVTIPNAEEVLEKVVKASGNTGRVYLPVGWVGRKIKIILLK